MLKFVSTKPPRGRSQSGLMTPDRDIIVRYTSHSESSPRIPPSPRVPSSPKSGKRSQAYTYPSSRGVQATPKSFSPGYKTVHFSGAGNTASSSRDAQKHGEASSDFRSLRYPEQYYQHNVSKQRQLQQQQPQQHPALPQQQNIEPPWPFQNGFHGSTSFPSHHGSTQFAPRTMPKPDTSTHLGATQPQPLGATQPQPLGSSLNAIRSNHRTHDRLSFNPETHTGQPSFYDIQKAKTLPKNSHIPTIISRDAENSLYLGDSKHQLKDIREPVKINCQYTRDTGHRGGATPTGGSDYDLAKPIIDSQVQIDTSQAAGQKTTQYIIEESLTKRRLSETYIPPPGSGVTPYTVERLVTEQAPPAGLRKFERSQTSGLRETGPFNATPEGLPVGTHQVMTSCVSSGSDAASRNLTSKKSNVISSQTHSSLASSTMRDMLNKSHEQAQMDSVSLDVVHITGRIISMTFPSDGHDTAYTINLKEALRVLRSKHGDHFLIVNLSEKHPELVKAHPQVKEFGWPDHLAPPLERLCLICKAIDTWLSSDSRHVVILHCKGGRSRLASVVAAYMHYNNICASAGQAEDSLAMKQYYDDKLGGLPLPSQRRYVSYFSGLLSGAIKINSQPLYLHHILIHGVPDFDNKGGCCPFIKVYQSMQPIFTSGVYNVTDNMQKVCISITPGIPLRGDILIKCYHKNARTGQKEVIWQCQFHTCAITGNQVFYSKQELDDAVLDPRFPDSGKVQFVFGSSSDVLVSVTGFKSDVTVPIVDSEESMVRTDSYEEFNKVSELAVDGHRGHDASFNSHLTPTASNNMHSSNSSISPSYASNQQTSQRTVQTSEERMQLDELLSNLLSDQVYVSPTKDSSRTLPAHAQPQQAAHLTSPAAAGDSITISPAMNSAKTVTTTTRTFTTYSATDAHRNPDNVLIQRSEVSYKVPTQGEVRGHYTDLPDAASSKPSQAYHPKGVPPNAFSYTSNTSSSQRADFVEQDVIRNQPDQGLQSPPTSQLTYYPRFEPKLAPSSSSQPASSPDGATDSWLAQQQQKLKSFKEGRDSSGHSEQEKKLMSELQFAQNKYYTHVTQHTVEDKPVPDAYNRQPLHNGPTLTEGPPPSYTLPHRSQSSSHVDGQWHDQFYNTSYSSSSYLESQTFGDKQSHKPPPSPIMQRSMPATSAPLPVPARSSSKEFMRTFSNSSSSNWQQHHRPLQRQHSETLYDRNHDVEPIQPRRYESAHNTPPHSPPRVVSPPPSGPANTTTYTAYRTMDRQKESQNDMHTSTVLHHGQQQAVPQQPAQVSHHYVTEVFVHRSDANKDKMDAVTHLEELEKNLEAASQSVKSSQQHVVPQQQRFEESLVSRSSHQYHTYQESVSKEESVSSLHHAERSMTQSRSQSPPVWDNVDAPEPPRVKEIEEDRIILRPIGPGMQTLEPENVHTGTLGRPSTPGFPTAPGGGQHMVNPTGTLQSASQQQQTMQYQQYQAQQYQTQTLHHDGQGQNTLHIDTSPRMIYPSQSPSAGSPPSPGNFNTFRQQMSESVGSLGGAHSVTGQSSPSLYYGLSRRGSLSSLTDSDMLHATPKFVKDTSKYWYKPNISREDAIQMLKDKHPGSFVIRDSNSFPGAYGLALKVATLPPNVQVKSSDPQADLVRHFLIEPTPKGVRLRGCSNEPVFGSLAALVYQHSITPLALPWKLALPEPDAVNGPNIAESMTATEVSSASTLLAQGAACNVIYVNSVDVESLTGPQAIAKAVKTTFENLVQGRTTMVHFKVFSEGITLTDNNRKLFFRRHYPVSAVTYCGMDPQDRRWKREMETPGGHGDARLFGFVARKQGTTNENTCHIFAEVDPEQPASAIVNFVTKVMIGQKN